jgi:hypothetical protein
MTKYGHEATKTIPINITALNNDDNCFVEPPPAIKFYIRASEHPLTDPRLRNYRIPIFIKTDRNISGAVIEKLVVAIDRNLFYPRRVLDNATATMALNFIDTVIEMTFENITVPALLAGEEKILFTIRGDVLLGDRDSCEIILKEPVKFADELTVNPELINGFMTLDICRECTDRLLTVFDYVPSVIVNPNPVEDGLLKIHCKTVERGDYSLEIVDMLGNSITVQEWSIAGSKRIFDFEIDVSNFASGSYFIIMNTPTARYTAKFVKQ